MEKIVDIITICIQILTSIEIPYLVWNDRTKIYKTCEKLVRKFDGILPILNDLNKSSDGPNEITVDSFVTKYLAYSFRDY